MSAKAPQILNIDSLATPMRVLTLGGVEYPVLDLTVENFIATSVSAERMKAAGAGGVEQIKETIEMLRRSIPTMPEGALEKLSIEKIGVVVQFVQGVLDPEILNPSASVPTTGSEVVPVEGEVKKD